MTVADLLQALYRDLNISDTAAPTAVITRLKSYLNDGHKALLREPSLSHLRDTLQPLTFASVAAQTTYGLPSQLVRIYNVTERDNDRKLRSLSLAELRLIDPGVQSSGTPWAFVPMGYGPLLYSPAATGVWAVSSSASDTAGPIVQINGVRSGGLPSGDVTATLTGTTRVAVGTFTDYVDIQSVTLSAVCAGLISLYDASSSGNLLAQIPIGQVYPRYYRVQLFPVPASAITYYVDGQYNIPILEDNDDVPMIPDEFHDLLAAYARMRDYLRTGDDERRLVAETEWTIGVNRLKYAVGSSPADSRVIGRRGRRGFSRLGPWTPADTWI